MTLAVDIGGSKLTVGIVTAQGSVLVKRRFALPKISDPEVLLDTVIEKSTGVLEDVGSSRIRCAGVTIPGLADPGRGMWVYSPFSGIESYPIAEALSRRLGFDVRIENDVNACAIGERAFGVCTGCEDFLWVTLSNGVGGGLILGGRVYRGATGFAGEVGHTVAVRGGLKDDAGIAGALEAYASGRGIRARYRQLSGRVPENGAVGVARLARRGDRHALSVFDTVGVCVGAVVAAAVNLLNLPTVVLGGGVSQSFDLFCDALRRTIAAEVFSAANPNPRVVVSRFPTEAALLGAAALAFGYVGAL